MIEQRKLRFSSQPKPNVDQIRDCSSSRHCKHTQLQSVKNGLTERSNNISFVSLFYGRSFRFTLIYLRRKKTC
jgi:hypothetical protein